ncbi:MAG: mobile mystery protein A [Saprospirales bacterium]|nr:mobile mystery protein A [Saprospirales bacterium]MBK6903914.1 mobile mystery protein A [Saprospirales bacterium]
MNKQSLQLQHLNAKMLSFIALQKVAPPPTGWIKAVRTALGMTLEQLGNKLSLTKQAAQAIENREKEGAITLKALRDAANALDMQLVYGFVPKDGSLDALINRKARELATQIVMRTSQTMKLEDQENSPERIKKAIEERTNALRSEMPKMLWN